MCVNVCAWVSDSSGSYVFALCLFSDFPVDTLRFGWKWTVSVTSAAFASFCSLSSCPSLPWMKPLRTEWSWRLHSLRIRSMPFPSSLTSSSTFSRDTSHKQRHIRPIPKDVFKHFCPRTIWVSKHVAKNGSACQNFNLLFAIIKIRGLIKKKQQIFTNRLGLLKSHSININWRLFCVIKSVMKLDL